MTASDVANGCEVNRKTAKMHDNHRPGFRRNQCLDRLRINVEGVELNVGKDRNCIGLDDCRGCCQERVRRDDHFVAGLDSRRQQGQAEGYRAVDHADAVVRPVIGGKVLLERGDLVAGQFSPATAFQRTDQGVTLRIAKDRP